MRNTWLKWLIRGAIALVVLLAVLDTALHHISRTKWFNTRVTTALENTLGRDVEVGAMGANLRGLFINNVRVAEQGGFENGTFLEAVHARVRFSLLHLLHAHVKLNSVTLAAITLHAKRAQDGTVNWADLSSPQQTDQTQDARMPFPFSLSAKQLRLEDLHVIYTDEITQRTWDIDELTLHIKHLRLNKPFAVRVYAQLRHTLHNATLYIPISAKLTADLKNQQWPQAYIELNAFTANLQDTTLRAKGRVDNFTNPHADLTFTLTNLSHDTLQDLIALPAFELDKATAHIKTALDTEKSAVTLHQFTLQAPGVEMQAKGGLLYKDPSHLQYDATANSTLVLGEIGRWLPALAEPYRLVGTLRTDIHATHQQLQAKMNLDDLGALLPQAGRVSDVNAKLDLQETMDFKTGNAQVESTGKVNGRPFTLALLANQKPDVIDVNVRLHAQEVALPPLAEPTAPAQTQADTPAKPWPLPPIRAVADVQLGHVQVPYFEGNNVVFTADMHGLTPDLKQAHGNLHLTTAQGTIQDIYKLTNANPLTKVLFLSLNLTGKVFNSLNVFGILSKLGNGVASAVTGEDEETQGPTHTQTILGPDGEPVEVVVPVTAQSSDGEMPYDTFDTQVDFVRGLATIKKGSFVSPVMSLRLDGTTDFNTQAVDLTVRAAPGRHEVDGMMPLTLKIGGTIDEPQGNMQLLGSVGALVTQGVTKNVVSRNVTKGIKGFFGLFKKDKPAEGTQP